MYLTPEQIADKAERFSGKANKAEINRLFTLQDESHKWPICGSYCVTEKAIRIVRRENSDMYGLEYALALDSVISSLVNSGI